MRRVSSVHGFVSGADDNKYVMVSELERGRVCSACVLPEGQCVLRVFYLRGSVFYLRGSVFYVCVL